MAAEQSTDNENWYQGTADAVRQSMRHLDKYDYDYILILSGDQLYQMDFRENDRFPSKMVEILPFATIPVNSKDATGFGILKANDENQITSFVEKPSADVLPDWTSEVSDDMKQQGRDYLASMGIYVFNKSFEKNV